MADEEFLAFQAEMNQLEGTEAPVTVAVGPRAPQVMVRGPQGPTPVKVKEPVALPQPPSGARLPVSQWPKPDHLVAQIQQDYPGNPMQLVRLLRHQSSARARTKRRLPDARRGRRAAPPRAPGQTPPVCPPICPPNPTARPRAHPRPAAHPPACPPACVPTHLRAHRVCAERAARVTREQLRAFGERRGRRRAASHALGGGGDESGPAAARADAGRRDH